MRPALAALVIGACGCSAAAPSLRRAIVVPTFAPVIADAEVPQNSEAIELAFRGLPLVPTSGSDSNPGIYAPRAAVGGGLKLRASPDMQLSFLADYASAATAVPLSPALPIKSAGDVIGFGLGATFWIVDTPHFEVVSGLEMIGYSIPVQSDTGCNCAADSGSALTVRYLATAGPRVKWNRFIFSAAVIAGNQPGVLAGSSIDSPQSESVAAIDAAPTAAGVIVGVDARFGDATLYVRATQILATATLTYGPVLQAGISVSLPDPHPKKSSNPQAKAAP